MRILSEKADTLSTLWRKMLENCGGHKEKKENIIGEIYAFGLSE